MIDLEEETEPDPADPALFQERDVIWILLLFNVLYMISIIIFIRLDQKLNLGNIEHAKSQDITDYKCLGRAPSEGQDDMISVPKRTSSLEAHIWRVRVYIFLCVLVLVATWISFGVITVTRP